MNNLVFPYSLASVAVYCFSAPNPQQHVVHVLDLSSAVACLHCFHQHVALAVGVAAVVELLLFAEQYALHAVLYHELFTCSISAPFPHRFQQLGELFRVFFFSIVSFLDAGFIMTVV